MDGERIFRGLVGLGVLACIVLFVVGFAAPILPPEIAGFMGKGTDAASAVGNATPPALPAGGAALPDETATVPGSLTGSAEPASSTPEPTTVNATSTLTETAVSTTTEIPSPTTAPTTVATTITTTPVAASIPFATANANATTVGASAVTPPNWGDVARTGTTGLPDTTAGVVTEPTPGTTTASPNSTMLPTPPLEIIASFATTADPTASPVTERTETPSLDPTVQPTPSPTIPPVPQETTIAPTAAPGMPTIEPTVTTMEPTVVTTEPTLVTAEPTAPPTTGVTLASPPLQKDRGEKDRGEKKGKGDSNKKDD